MKAKKSLQIFILLIVTNITLFLSALYIYDPLQVFHTPWGTKITFHKNMRQQAAGIINNYDFDSVILGTSMLENTSANEASTLLGGHFVNISMEASDFYERNIVLNYLLAKKKIHTVLYSLDADKYLMQKRGNKKYLLENFTYLYDKNIFNDIQVYLNTKYLKCLMRFSNSKECRGDKIGLDRPCSWYQYRGHSIRFGGLDKWFAAKNNRQIRNAFRSISNTAKQIRHKKSIGLSNIEEKIVKTKKYIDDTILTLVHQYPNTKFLMVFPPYSRIYYSRWAQYNKPSFKIHQETIRYLSIQSHLYPNLQIFGFEDKSFVDDIANYKDPKHYHYSINSLMLKKIASKKGLLNNHNISAYLKECKEKALKFNLTGLGQKIDTYLKIKK